MAGYRLGIDVGGTFTDFVVLDEKAGTLLPFKTPTTPNWPTDAIVAGIGTLERDGRLDPAEVSSFVHGTTLATNIIIERRGAVTGLLVTRGFRDILTIARLRLENPFDFTAERPAALVPRHLTREVDERIRADGAVLQPLDEAGLLREAAALREQGIEALAVAFMNAYRNPTHEQRAVELIREVYPDLYVCGSAELWPQIREYERTLVAVMNAYVGKRLDSYFERLSAELAATGIKSRIFVSKSNGGIMSAEGARKTPVELLLSGPAAGVVGASYLAGLAGFPRIITIDIGGTSADLSVVDGNPLFSTEAEVGEFPVTLPAVDVTAIGAGGGSIAWIDGAGVLKVGPRSAGAEPGPACYDKGGEEPTITDAYVVLGLIDPVNFLGGTMRLIPERAQETLAVIAQRLNRGIEAAAEAVLAVATSNMYRELISVLARRGIDPTDFALFVFGGAGPTQGFLLAEEIGFRNVVVPPSPGVLCALGAVAADVKRDFIRTTYIRLVPGHLAPVVPALVDILRGLERQARAWLAEERLSGVHIELRSSIDMRYVGQSFEIEVPLESDDTGSQSGLAALLAQFHDRHRQIYGYAETSGAVEAINVRTTVIGRTVKPCIPELPPGGPPPKLGKRRIYHRGAWHEGAVASRSELPRDYMLPGPAVIEQYDTTTFVPPGWRVQVDRFGNLIGDQLA